MWEESIDEVQHTLELETTESVGYSRTWTTVAMKSELEHTCANKS